MASRDKMPRGPSRTQVEVEVIAVNALIIGPRSLSDKKWEGLTGCPCLSMLN